jgi:hypothetical protein
MSRKARHHARNSLSVAVFHTHVMLKISRCLPITDRLAPLTRLRRSQLSLVGVARVGGGLPGSLLGRHAVGRQAAARLPRARDFILPFVIKVGHCLVLCFEITCFYRTPVSVCVVHRGSMPIFFHSHSANSNNVFSLPPPWVLISGRAGILHIYGLMSHFNKNVMRAAALHRSFELI